MDDLLVIIITILIAVVGVFNQRKKKRDAQQPVSEDTGESTDFWEMLMQQEERKPVFQPIQEEAGEDEDYEAYEDPVPKQEQPVYQFKAGEEGSSEVTEEKKILQREVKKKVLIEGEEFSLRKAVIYNEILNRKYT
ncbi:MAG: hypothetical protein ACK5M7_18995 [Draconibacterium sp.]